MSAYSPAFLDLRDKPVTVIGGGVVAERKVEQLLASGARVTVISPDLTEALRAFAGRHAIDHLQRAYQPGDLAGSKLAIAATDDMAANRAAAAEARTLGVWVNAVDDVKYCDFIAPAVVEQGDITVAISTGGRSPAIARFLRRQMEAFLSEDFAALLTIAEDVRARLRREGRTVSPETWQRALDGGVWPLVSHGRRDEAAALLYHNLAGAGVIS